MIDITAQVEALQENIQHGLVAIYSPHTTAGITINIRSSGVPESEHKEIYRLLNIKDPLKRNRSLKGKRL